MKVITLLVLQLATFSTLAANLQIPTFDCVDIHGSRVNIPTENVQYKSKSASGFGQYSFSDNKELTVDITSSKFDDGYYYGNAYMDKEYKYYIDIKCTVQN